MRKDCASETCPQQFSADTADSKTSIRSVFWKIQIYGVAVIAFSSFFPSLVHLQEYLFLLLLAAVVGISVADRVIPGIKTSIDIPIGCFVIWVLCTVPFATDISYSFVEWRKFITHALAFYWASVVFQKQHQRHWQSLIFGAVLAGGLCLAVYAMSDFFLQGGSWRYSRAFRAGAPSSDYNWLSTYLVLVMPLFVAGWFIYRAWWARLVIALALVLGAMAQVASYTRAGWLAHAAQGLGYGLVLRRRQSMIVLIGICVLIGLFTQVNLLGWRQTDTLNPWTLDARFSVWKLGLTDIRDHPFVGVGYGNGTFLKRHQEFVPEAQLYKDEQARVLPAMHNTFLMVALGSGLPAFAAFVWIFVAIMRRLVVIKKVDLHTDMGVLSLAIGMAVFGFAVRNGFDYMFAGSMSYLFWILVAYGFAVRNAQSAIRVDDKFHCSPVERDP
jgi:heptosyltransferase-3/putative inorganic carbon (HCO3(-)) transporter